MSGNGMPLRLSREIEKRLFCSFLRVSFYFKESKSIIKATPQLFWAKIVLSDRRVSFLRTIYISSKNNESLYACEHPRR